MRAATVHIDTHNNNTDLCSTGQGISFGSSQNPIIASCFEPLLSAFHHKRIPVVTVCTTYFNIQ